MLFRRIFISMISGTRGTTSNSGSHEFWARLGTDPDGSHCSITTGRRDPSLTRANAVERVTRIELA